MLKSSSVDKLNPKTIEACRVCFGNQILLVHDFGQLPIADKLGTSPEDFVDTANLSVGFCISCCHLQVLETVSPEILFKYDYPYYSSAIPEVVRHFKTTFESIINKFNIDKEDIVIEIAANDGVLLNNFKDLTSNLISVEPSLAQSAITIKNGIKTYQEFFCFDLSEKIKNELLKNPKLVLANNVLAHVPNPDDFMKGVSNLMGENTTFVLEVPHALPMIKNNTFDVIFHQHYSYFNLKTLSFLFEKHQLYINDIEKIETQGGSLRLFISKKKLIAQNFNEIIEEEEKLGLYNLKTYQKFSEHILRLKSDTINLLQNLNSQGKSIVAYGAPGKAANYLNYFGLNTNYFKFIVDISPSKQYKYFPNTGLQILPLSSLDNIGIDFVFILVWNYADSIMENLNYLRSKHVKFIVGFPELSVL